MLRIAVGGELDNARGFVGMHGKDGGGAGKPQRFAEANQGLTAIVQHALRRPGGPVLANHLDVVSTRLKVF